MEILFSSDLLPVQTASLVKLNLLALLFSLLEGSERRLIYGVVKVSVL